MIDDASGRGSALGRDTGIFVDFLFSLVAVLIVALSLARGDLADTTGQLRSSGLTREYILLALACGPDNVDPVSLACTKSGDGINKFHFATSGRENIAELFVDFGSGVLVAADASEEGEGFFLPSKTYVTGHGKKAIDALRDRLNAILPCFAAIDKEKSDSYAPPNSNCSEVWSHAKDFISGRLHNTSARKVTISDLGVIELIVFEGHSDAVATGTDDIGERRARTFLLAMIDPDFNAASSDIRKEEILSHLDNLNANAPIFSSALFNYVSIHQRIFQECKDRQEQLCLPFKRSAAQTGALLSDQVQENEDEPGARQEAPRIFALSSFGRYSLRFGQLYQSADPRDRRVEIRIVMAEVPREIWEIDSNNEGANQQQFQYINLFSAAAAQAFQNCDLAKDSNCLRYLKEAVSE